MATNYLGHFHLVNLLLPVLRRSAPARIIHISSMAHEFGNMTVNNLKRVFTPTEAQYHDWMSYRKFTLTVHRDACFAIILYCSVETSDNPDR